eukprot:CAMPEP_0202896284 /NCGR_PEP_ID=MMETSP1392-20130828/5314_1 /ASSEMBLY_ACC=CAM_ASM_000868 /TAXON_ID=225041 /ORGANISM="Chlamydomonas chlamydogama, Strain SAG 11-48b" /LENGTH=254 /DNA_ID=CAMNT_0049581579 /DNA_START=109 /DNA_END=874 /DNA_ORIENTATION=-
MALQQRLSTLRGPPRASERQTSSTRSIIFPHKHKAFAALSLPFSTIAQQSITGDALTNFSGTWIKDKHASDSMDKAMTLMHLSGVVRQAVKLVKGVNIKQDDTTFTMEVFSYIGWFKVTEMYKLDGTVSQCKRRDLRKGGHRGSMKALPPAPAPTPSPSLIVNTPASEQQQQQQGRMLLSLEWGEPHGGTGTDVFSMPSVDVLHIDSTIHVGGDTAQYRSVYKRKHKKPLQQQHLAAAVVVAVGCHWKQYQAQE